MTDNNKERKTEAKANNEIMASQKKSDNSNVMDNIEKLKVIPNVAGCHIVVPVEFPAIEQDHYMQFTVFHTDTVANFKENILREEPDLRIKFRSLAGHRISSASICLSLGEFIITINDTPFLIKIHGNNEKPKGRRRRSKGTFTGTQPDILQTYSRRKSIK